jgi:hypothetical protein
MAIPVAALTAALIPALEKYVVPRIVEAIGKGDENVARTRRNADAAAADRLVRRAVREALEENAEGIADVLRRAGVKILKEEKDDA